MSQDNWNIGNWFQSALDALRGNPAPEEPPYVPPDAPAGDWSFDPSQGDWGPYHLDNGAVPVVSGLGDMFQQWGKIPADVGKAWAAPWQDKEPEAPVAPQPVPSYSDLETAWATGQRMDTPAWANLAQSAKETVQEAEQSPIGGAVKAAESVGGAAAAALGDFIMPLGIPAQGTEEFLGDLKAAGALDALNLVPIIGAGSLARDIIAPQHKQAEQDIAALRESLRARPDTLMQVDDYLSSRFYSSPAVKLQGARAVAEGMPAAAAKDKYQDFLNELAGQVVLDPLNLIDVPFKAAGLWKTTEEIHRLRATKGLDALAGFTRETASSITTSAMVRASAPENVADTINFLRRFDPDSTRKIVVEKAATAMDIVRAGLTDADAGLLPDRIVAFVKGDAAALARTGGYLNARDAQQLIDSEAGVHLYSMLKEVMTDDATRQLDPDIFAKLLKDKDTVEAATHAIMEKMVKALDQYAPMPDPAAGMGNPAWEWYKSAILKVKNVAAHVFVGTWGVVVGNIVGNEITQVYDGVRASERLSAIEDALKIRQIDPPRAFGGGLGSKSLTQLETQTSTTFPREYGQIYGGALARKTVGVVNGKPVKEPLSSYLWGQLSGGRRLEEYGEAEQAARVRTYYAAMMNWEREAAPTLVNDLSQFYRAKGVELGEVETALRGAMTDLDPRRIKTTFDDLAARLAKNEPIPPTVDAVTSEAAKTALWEARKAGWSDVIAQVNEIVAKHADDPAAIRTEMDKLRQSVVKQYNDAAQAMRAAATKDSAALKKTRAVKTDPRKEYKTQDGVGAVEQWRGEQVAPEYVAAIAAKYGDGAATDFATRYAEVHTRAWDGFKAWSETLVERHRAKYPNKRVPQAEWEKLQDMKADATRRIFARELAFLQAVEDANGGIRHVDPSKRYFDNIKGFFARNDKPIGADELAEGKAWLAQNGLLPDGYVQAVPATHAHIADETRRVAALDEAALRAEVSAKMATGDASPELIERFNALNDAAKNAPQVPRQPADAGVGVAPATPLSPAPAPVTPVAPVVPAVSNRVRYETELKQIVMAGNTNIAPAQLDTYLAYQDQLAQTWARLTGRNADEFYSGLSVVINPSDAGLEKTSADLVLGNYLYDPATGKRTIGLFDRLSGKGVADFETLVHETGHDLRAMMDDLYRTVGDGDAVVTQFKRDYDTFTDWATNGSKVWDTAAEEKFANGLTQYMRSDFSAVPQALHAIFEQVKQWLLGIVGKADDETKLAPEVQAAYRRYLSQYQDVGYKVAREKLDALARELQQQALAAGETKIGGALATSVRKGGKGEPIYMSVLNKHRTAGTPKFDAENLANRMEEATAILQDYAVTKHLKQETVSVLRDAGVADDTLAVLEPTVADDMAKNTLDAGKVTPAQVAPVVEVTPEATVTVPRQMPARLADEDIARFFDQLKPKDVWVGGADFKGERGWAPPAGFGKSEYEIPGAETARVYKSPQGTFLLEGRDGKSYAATKVSGDQVEGWRKAVAKYLTGDENAYDDVVQMIRAQRVRTLLPSEADAAKIGKANLPQQGVAKTVKDYVLAKIQENFAHLEAGGIVEITVPGYGKITLHSPEQGARAFSTFGGKADNATGPLQVRIQMGDKVTAFGGYGTPKPPVAGELPPSLKYPEKYGRLTAFNLDPDAPSLVTVPKGKKPLFHSRPPADDLHAIIDDLNDATRRGDEEARLAAEERLKQFHGKAEYHDAILAGKKTVADSGGDAMDAAYHEMVGQRAARFVESMKELADIAPASIPAPKGLTVKQVREIEREAQSRATVLRAAAQKYGQERRDFALLDGKRRNFDWLMSAVYPFHYWYTRSYVNWGKRMLDNPRLPLSYIKVQNALEDINKDVPPQYRKSIPLDIAGTRHYFDWQAMMNPLRSLIDDFSVEQRQKDDMGKLLNIAGSWGSAPWQIWTWAYAITKAAQGDKETLQAWFNYALPSTRVTRATTALMREAGVKSLPVVGDIPAGGFYPEDWLFNAFGVKGQGDMWEARRIGKALSDLLGEKHPQTGKPVTMTDITRAAYYREGAIWDMARQKAIADQAGGTLASFFGIRGAKLRSEDLARQEQAQNEYYALQKSYYDDRKLTDAQYKDAIKGFYEKYPWYSVYRMAKQNDMERVSTFTMDVLNRIPPGQRVKTEEDLNIKDFVDKFWAASDRDAFLTEQQQKAPLAYKRFIAAVETLDGNYNIPSNDTRKEWDHFNALRDEYFKMSDRDQQAAFKDANPLLAKYMPDTDTERFWRAYYALDPQGRKLLRAVPELKGIDVYLDKGTRDIVNEKGIAQIAGATELFAARLMETPAYKGWLAGTQQFGGEKIYDIQSAFYDISADNKAERAKFKQEHPELEAFWRWRDGYLKLNPALAAAFANKGAQPQNVAAAIAGGVPKDSGNSTAIIARQKFGDGIYDTQDAYFAIPETDKAGRKAFLAEHPELVRYWEWRRAATASSDPRLDQASAAIKKAMGSDFANYTGIPFLQGGGGGGGAGRAYINAVRNKYTPNLTESEFILAVGTRLKIGPYFQTQKQPDAYSRAPQSTRFIVPFSRR